MNKHTSWPKISIIVAVYNGEKTLQRCVDSVFSQTYPHKELIIIDGGSKDDTVDILRANNDKITYWKSEPDNGIYHAWNKALDYIKGDWICFLGADDYLWKPDVLEHMRDYLVKATAIGVRIVYGQVAIVTGRGEVLYTVNEKSWEKIKLFFLQRIGLSHQGIVHHKSLFETHGKFDESFLIAGDYDLLLRELKTKDACFMNDLIVAGMQLGGISTDPANRTQGLRENAQARLNNGIRTVMPLWITWRLKSGLYEIARPLIGERGIRRLSSLIGRLKERKGRKEKVSGLNN